MDQPVTKPANRLIHETSLYLRQHAFNPVHWHPWGPEALQKAKDFDRPIFLSIGYSACHWCHVMEHESFEDEATAKVLNENFVNIKVDREERPDLDAIYMNALQVLTREGGGWPLSVFLTPTLTPFYAGTYYPPDDRLAPQRPSFRKLLAVLINAYRDRRDHITEVGNNVVQYLQATARFEAAEGALDEQLLRNALESLRKNFDTTHGGFGHSPKFPHALELRLLLRIARRFNDPGSFHMVRQSLEKMARGGLFDQLAGGFARYSVDERWLVPHFEKMLYDNALLTSAYVEAFRETHDPFYQQIARETLDFVLREMTSPGGAFFSTLDADSEGEEGKFYVWSVAEIEASLGKDLASFASKVWGVTPRGNFEGHNILFRTRTDQEDAAKLSMDLPSFRDRLADARAKLLAVRNERIRPARDEKLLTSWNGLMISAFAQAGSAFDEPRYLEAASRAAKDVLANLRDSSGRLHHTSGVGQKAKINGYLEDYAFLADALVTLYESTFESHWLTTAVELVERILARFSDHESPGFFYTSDDHERLIARTKDLHDGSTPSGNAVAVMALLRLGKLGGRADFLTRAADTLKGYRGLMVEHPAACGQMLIALDFFLGPIDEVAVIGPTPEATSILRAIQGEFHPHCVLAFHDPAKGTPPDEIPLLKDRHTLDGKVTTYVCRDYICKAPMDPDEAIAAFTSRDR